jgi:tRNA(fMet)-specific endonuclease VapC
MIYLPDTNVASRYLRGRDELLRERFDANLPYCRLSSVVLSELEYGAAKQPDLPVLRERVRRVRTLLGTHVDYTCEDALFYGFIRSHLARLKPNAQPIGPMDLMLAAQALRLGAVVATGNVAEFSRVPGLRVEDWGRS